MVREFHDRLSGLDRSFLVLEGPNTHMHIAAALILEAQPLLTADGSVDIDRIRRYIGTRLHLLPRYRQRLESGPIDGHPIWVDDEHFNLDYHVRHTSLPRPGDDRQLKRLVARIMSQQLDRAKPLWETWVVEGVQGGRVALVTKTHHCMIDGVAGVDLLTLLMSPERECGIQAAPAFVPRPAPSGSSAIVADLLRRASVPLTLGRDLARALLSPTSLRDELAERIRGVTDTLAVGLRGTSATPLNQPIGPHRRFDWVTMDLDDVRAVKRKLGGTLNDLVLAIVAGAARRFLQHRRVELDGLEFRVMTPVSVRQSDAASAVGNQISMWLVDLPLAEADPVARLAAISRRTAELVERKNALGAQVLAAGMEFTGATLLSRGMQMIARAQPFNLVVTNVPGPQVPLYLLGSQIEACFPVVPLWENQGLGIALFSYAGQLYWGFNADWDLLPDISSFVDAIVASFNELREAGLVLPDPEREEPAQAAELRALEPPPANA